MYNERSGWREVATDAEVERLRELAIFHRDAIRAARNEAQTPQTNGSTGVQIGNPTVDITGEVIQPPTIDVKM